MFARLRRIIRNQDMDIKDLKKINDYLWEIPQSYRADMRVPARIFATEDMLPDIFRDRSVWQLINLTTLPGIQKYALAMPDIHEGYGSPIGGVCATLPPEGIISPGLIGYDVNCGVRLLRSELIYNDIKAYLPDLASQIYRDVPSGVGRGGRFKLSASEMDKVFIDGAKRMVELGFGTAEDLIRAEEGGSMPGADPSAVSDHAKSRGQDQLGTLGSGNHFLEIQKVEEIFDEESAKTFGLFKNQVTVAIHCGSRGLGHQIATDYIRLMIPNLERHKITLPDRELAGAPFTSPEGQKYFRAMVGASNFAWANRQMIMHLVREAWKRVLSKNGIKKSLELPLVYDVAHNIGKLEKHHINGKEVEVIMHRKGATRAFGPGSAEIPEDYRRAGQPVLIPGTMGTSSYVLVGTLEARDLAFGSSCHGAGRRMSRAQAKREVRGSELRQELEGRGIIIRCDSNAGLAEEAPTAYKDIDQVVNVVAGAGIARKVAKLLPIAVIKGG